MNFVDAMVMEKTFSLVETRLHAIPQQNTADITRLLATSDVNKHYSHLPAKIFGGVRLEWESIHSF